MGRLARFLSFARETVGGVALALVKLDPGGGANLRAQHYADSGDASQPLDGDFVATTGSPGSGNEHVTGYHDPSAPTDAGPGEKLIYSRSGPGVVAAKVWLKNDTSIVAENAEGSFELGADGTITINGTRFLPGGIVEAPGEVTALADSTPIAVSIHVHPSAVGPTGTPTPTG